MEFQNTAASRIDALHKSQREYFRSGATLDISFRKKMLKTLLNAIKNNEKLICDALWKDLHKSYEEAYLTEISIVTQEIESHIRHLRGWARREHRKSPITIFGSSSYVVKEPLGNTLIVSPWNYPFQLLLNPLVGAISAGCTAILKPSPYVPEVSLAIEKMITEAFPEEYIAVVQGNREVNTKLFDLKFDLIFFTGSPALAKTVAAAAAKNLTPMILELGGKSPCIVDRYADVKLAAKRIAWGKTINSGQTCIAPDYILIHEDVKAEFVKYFGDAVKELHGLDIKQSMHYARMVSSKAFERVSSYIEEGDVVYGGHVDADQRFIEPTLLENVREGAKVLEDEIFGPVFPIITLNDEGNRFDEKVIDYVNDREKPLALYYFGNKELAWNVIEHTSAGGTCVNDTIMHIANANIPFGGVGNSGMGHYHGKESFEAFTHRRAVVSTPVLFDLPFRYMPYKTFPLIKKIL